jgi:hypothetical protein
MKTKLKILALLSALIWQSTAMAASDKQLLAVAEMGRLNGVALQCKYLDQVQEIKRLLVLNLPKERALGDWFEQKTSASYMGFIESKVGCPGLIQFDEALKKATSQLETVFKK